MTPASWGHSLLLGRAKYHLTWTLQDLSIEQCVQLATYLKIQSTFPDITNFHTAEARKALMLVDGLEAYEIASAMIVMPFALASLSPPVPGSVLQSWRLHNVLMVDYYREGFTPVQVHSHSRHWAFLQAALERAFIRNNPVRKISDKIKLHDPEHDQETIINYGNFRVINELAKESTHQIPKHMTHNNRDVEQQILKRVH